MSLQPTSPLTVGLVQVNAALSWTRQSFHGRKRAGAAVAGGAPTAEGWTIFPYGAGLLEAYARAHGPGDTALRFLPPVYRREALADMAAQLAPADVVGFSTYVWNVRLSLALAERLKRERPECVVVLGGPQVPDDAEAFLREHPFVDVVVHGEGEAVFADLLGRVAARDWAGLGSVSWLAADGRCVAEPRRQRLRDLDAIPSPYLEGLFDRLFVERPEERWVLLWETNRGCPFSCAFCDWGSATASKVHRFDMTRLERELEWMADRRIEFVFCCDANFGLLPRDLELARAAADVKGRRGFPRTLSVQNAKNATDRVYEVQRTLGEAGMNPGVTLSLQSLDPGALAAIRRANISSESFRDLQRRYTRDGVATYTDIILSLPGESYDTYARGIGQLIADGQHNRVQAYNCAVLPNAALAEPAYRATHGLETMPQRIVSVHAPIAAVDAEEVPEALDIVVATAAMPRGDWVRTKVFTWLAELLYFDRLLQVPMVVAHAAAGIGFREMLEALVWADAARAPRLAGVREHLVAHARSVQAGAPDTIPVPEWLGLHWPPDQWAVLHLATTWQLDACVEELGQVLRDAVARHARGAAPPILDDALALGALLFRQPFEVHDATLRLEHDVWGVYRAVLEGRPVDLAPAPTEYHVNRTNPVWLDWDGWMEHVVFCHNQRATFLYPVQTVRATLDPAFAAEVAFAH